MPIENITKDYDKQIIAELVLCKTPKAVRVAASERGLVLSELEAEVLYSVLQTMQGKELITEEDIANLSDELAGARPTKFI